MKYGYIRVSTKEQDETRQIQALKNNGVALDKIYVEKASGKNFIDRTEWTKLMAVVSIGDIIVIKELDRLGRNNQEIKDTYALIGKKGVYLEFLDTPELNTYGKSKIELELIQPLVLHLLGYLAEKEREKMKERQREAYNTLPKDEKGRLVSRKKNKVVGRPNKQENLTKEQERFIEAWISGSIKLSDCIKATGLSQATLYRIKTNSMKQL